jgi:hypothetical protein
MPIAQTHITTFNPNPIQNAFITSTALADLFSSRAGEGKSTALAWAFFYFTRANPGANLVMIRDTFTNLEKTTMKSFFEWFPPGVFGDYHATKKEFVWREGVAKGSVSFIGIEDPADASKLLSWEIAGFGMDEPAPAFGSAGIDEAVFDLAMTRMRQPGMSHYIAKLATNNPDESHWTFRKFVSPGIEGFRLHQPTNPENINNLPENYYENIRKTLAHRPDLVRRFVDGEFGFQSEGVAVTPQWSDRVHLANGLVAIPRRDIHLLWDFGLNPTCIVTQKTPLGHWNILDSAVGEGIGVTELIGDIVKPLLADRYRGNPLSHIGDPQGVQREQSSSLNSAVRVIKQELGGTYRAGPQKWPPRRDAIQSVLTKMVGGRGVVQVDRQRAPEVWFALRGGWHYHKARTGVVSADPKKNIHSHPADAMSYGAAVLFPTGKIMAGSNATAPSAGSYFGSSNEPANWRIGPEGNRPPLEDGAKMPVAK